MARIDFLLMSDANYTWQLTTAIAGILCACRRNDCVFHVIDCGISDIAWGRLVDDISAVAARHRSTYSLDRLHPEMAVLSRMKSYRGTVATYSRLLAPRLLPTVNHCVYVDCDVLMIDDIEDLYRAFVKSGCLVGGHVDVEPTRHTERRFLERNGLPVDEDEYICCGLLLMNLEALRRTNFTEDVFRFIDQHSDVPFADQSAINYICRGQKYIVDGGWGLMASECYGSTAVSAIHFAGCCPWTSIPSWYEYIAFSRVLDLWYGFCEREFGLEAMRRRYNSLIDDCAHAILAFVLTQMAEWICFLRLPFKRWHSLNRYAKNCSDDFQIRAATERMSRNLDWRLDNV